MSAQKKYLEDISDLPGHPDNAVQWHKSPLKKVSQSFRQTKVRLVAVTQVHLKKP